jgi:iron only hydrogenase large subunit-like protein
MPCFDKKLESSRKEFFNESLKTKDVDCVLSTLEIENLLEKESVDLTSLEEEDLDRPFDLFKNLK